ncbi:hypothetical protein D1872_274210 [compost metagenome]
MPLGIGNFLHGERLDAAPLVTDDRKGGRHLERTDRRGAERQGGHGLERARNAHFPPKFDDLLGPDRQDRVDGVNVVRGRDRLAHVDVAQVFVAEISRAVSFAVVIVMEQRWLAAELARASQLAGGQRR